MKGSFARIAFALLAMVVGSALEELLPHPGGVGFPLLLAFTLFVAANWGVPAMVCVAMAAGGCEDALSGLPYFASMMFFLLGAAGIRWSRSPVACEVVAYPAYQLWLAFWGHIGFAAMLPRFLWSLPVGAATVYLTRRACAWLSERAGLE